VQCNVHVVYGKSYHREVMGTIGEGVDEVKC
jgi:hypothetical protein